MASDAVRGGRGASDGLQHGDLPRAAFSAILVYPMAMRTFTAVVEKEGNGYVALCPELDVASQGSSIEEATANLKEAVELFLECADPNEIERRTHTEVYVTRFDAAHG